MPTDVVVTPDLLVATVIWCATVLVVLVIVGVGDAVRRRRR